jgi:hypothetical protein
MVYDSATIMSLTQFGTYTETPKIPTQSLKLQSFEPQIVEMVYFVGSSMEYRGTEPNPNFSNQRGCDSVNLSSKMLHGSSTSVQGMDLQYQVRIWVNCV